MLSDPTLPEPPKKNKVQSDEDEEHLDSFQPSDWTK